MDDKINKTEIFVDENTLFRKFFLYGTSSTLTLINPNWLFLNFND